MFTGIIEEIGKLRQIMLTGNSGQLRTRFQAFVESLEIKRL